MLLNLNFPDIPLPSGIQSLSRNIDSALDDLLFKDVRLPELPPRDISVILNLAESGLDAQVSVLEWIALLDGKERWDSVNHNQEYSSNILIWKTACKNHGLRYLLYWRLALYLDGHEISFSKGLVKQFANFQKYLAKVDKQRTLLLTGIYSGDTSELCQRALIFRMLPAQVLSKCGLPGQIKHSKDALKGLARYWVKNNKMFGYDELFTIIAKLNDEEKDTFFSSALVDIPFAKLEQQETLLKLILGIYSPYVINSRFSKLNNAAQEVIKDLIGAMSFADFSKLIAKLTEPVVAGKLGLEEWEIRQLNSRVAFWSNYQNRLLGFSVFLPTSTYSLLKQMNFITDDLLFHKLINSNCEVCVLEFENHFILEFLRGSISGVRVIDKLSKQAQLLKNVSSVSSQQQLEAIPFLAEHDHFIYWQNACEKLLRTKFNLTPNKNLRKFLVTRKDKNGHTFYQEYSSLNGLPSLTAAQVLEREEVLMARKRRSLESTNGKLNSTPPSLELAKSIIQFFSEKSTSGGWFGYSKKHGWIIEVGGSSSGLVFKCLSNNKVISASYNDLEGAEYMKVVDYLNTFQDASSLNEACMSLASIAENIPISSVRSALSNIISKAKIFRNTQSKMVEINKKHAFSEDDLIALASAQGGAHLDNRHKGGVLKIALQKPNSELEKLLLISGFKEIIDKPLVFWKK
ncbi:EH signature domain-containing protein [Alkalimonas sp. MEB108]|uniref:EH signature domain-containing protein n=1 Tax=Alkalimonas cellulosilytica TaxID=3058395 RepID=A0ABU7J2S0_9GAMM|nr:EH signature domain-containing protein [Alkalimonas sp. MEB108]MEE2000709.1 EH signature domain-containing protein [Alkalimonas sp. MEB108]